jgi:gliding motility-associated-like protein
LSWCGSGFLNEKIIFMTMKSLHIRLVFFLMLLCSGLVAQEICDNGIDDDGDGHIDLNDPDCICLGISVQIDVTDMIPNPDFESMSCCPKQASWMHCVDSWAHGKGTVDYIHECGYIPSIDGLVPFPSGSGVLGTIWRNNYKEYPFVCLNQPLKSGEVYTLTLQIGAKLFAQDCQPKNISEMSPVDLTLYGNTSCNYLWNNNGCPLWGDPTWQVIGTVNYQPINEWQEIRIVIEPTFDVNGIMLGAPCVLPPEYMPFCYVYVLYDDLRLELAGDELIQVEINPVGSPCQLGYGLTGFINHQGGQWQWYYNGVAIGGATEVFFALEDNQHQSGTYQVTYTTANGCSVDSIQLTIPPLNITENEVYFCQEAEAECGGLTYNEEGEYMIVLSAFDGCDSIIICQVVSFNHIPSTVLEIDACADFSTTICGNIFDATGNYTVTCTNENDCDSVVVLDLRIMNPPHAIIEAHKLVDCDPNSWVTLDGTASSFNELPSGTTTYEWTGDPNGFIEGQFEPIAIVSLPGEYCLILTFEINGVTCADTACIIVNSALILPSPPIIFGNQSACIGDTLIFQGSYQGLVETDGWEWLFVPNPNYLNLDDSTLIAIPTVAGDISICARMLSECGPSDTTCLEISVFQHDMIIIQGNACDSTQVGVFIENLTNLYGCDSMVIHEISLSPSHLIQVELTTCDPLQVMSDTLFLTNHYGCDSIVTIDIHYMGVDTQYVQMTTCDPSQVGVVISSISGIYCDTIIVRETALLPSSVSQITEISCEDSGLSLDTIYYNNMHGCDSLVIRSIAYVNLKVDIDVINQHCTDESDGVIIATHISGGQSPLEYQLMNGMWQSSPMFSGLPPGIYSIIVREATGCVDTFSGIAIPEGVQLNIDAGPDHVVQEGSYIKFNVTSNHPISQLQWSALDPLTCSHCTSPMLGPVTTSQSVWVSAQTADGCTASDEVLVSVVSQPTVYIPNGFTPNNDGINDVFTVYGNEQVVGIRNLTIYDRWGNALYYREDLPINDPYEGWDGSFRGQPMNSAVFVYVVVVELLDGSTKLYKGDVNLVR